MHILTAGVGGKSRGQPCGPWVEEGLVGVRRREAGGRYLVPLSEFHVFLAA